MRKIIMVVVGIVAAIYGLFGVTLGIADKVNVAGSVGSLLLVAAYVFTEGRTDFKDFVAGVKQSNKWSDPAFWVSLIGAVLLPITTQFGLVISAETIGTIAAILAIVAPILAKLFRKTAPTT